MLYSVQLAPAGSGRLSLATERMPAIRQWLLVSGHTMGQKVQIAPHVDDGEARKANWNQAQGSLVAG